jgi:hypothetical protein
MRFGRRRQHRLPKAQRLDATTAGRPDQNSPASCGTAEVQS